MNRGRVSRSVARLGGLAALGAVACACGPPASGGAEWSSSGTPAAALVHARGERDVEALLSEIRRSIERARQDLDPRSAAGELTQLNRDAATGFHEGTRIDLYACLTLALDYARLSSGAYDPTIGALTRLYGTRRGGADPPGSTEVEVALAGVGWEKLTLDPGTRAVGFRVPGLELDLGSVASGCAVDWAARVFARPGSVAGWIRLDGVHRAWQRPPGQPLWSLLLEDPRLASRVLLSIGVANRAVAVCGQADPAVGGTAPDRPPLLDPRTGQPAASDLLAVVTTADSGADAAALCQAVYVAGSLAGPAVLAHMRRVEAFLLVRADAAAPYAVASAALRGRIELGPELEREIHGDVRYLLP